MSEACTRHMIVHTVTERGKPCKLGMRLFVAEESAENRL